jgi:choline monooxygenase
MDDAVGFDPAGFSLHRIGVATWSRFVFVRPSPTGPDFDLGRLARAVDPYPIDEMELSIREDRTGAFNWKVLVENYSENFHTPFVHPELIVRGWDYPIVTDGAIALAWDRPQQPRNASERALATATPLDDAWAGVARDQIDDVFIAGVYLTVFPNLLVSLFPRYLSAIRLTPLSANRTQIDYYRCWHASVAPARRTADHEATLVVVEQDLRICEQVQLGYDGGVDTDGRLSPEHETGVHHVHELLRAGERVSQ